MKEWAPPRCIHGRLILACPDDDCPTQNAHLDQMAAAMDDYYATLERNAAAAVRGLLGVD